MAVVGLGVVVVVVAAVVVVVVVAVARTAAAAVVVVAAAVETDRSRKDRRGGHMSSSSADECRRRRGRRTGAVAVAGVYSGDQRQATPPFPSVCRLVEKYTMLIERHRQNQQNGLTAPVRGKPSPLSSSSSSPTTPLQQPAVLSSPAVGGEDAAAWNHLLMDGGGCENKNNDVDGNGHDVDSYGYDDYYDDDDDGCGRRFSCVSLGSIQPGTCARDCCDYCRRRCRDRLAVIVAASAAERGGDKLPVTTCSRLSAIARAHNNIITQRRPMCLGRRSFPFPLSVSSISAIWVRIARGVWLCH